MLKYIRSTAPAAHISEDIVNTFFRTFMVLAGAVLTAVLVGCSTMVPTPTMPSAPAQVGGKRGISYDVDVACRSQAQQAAEQAKQQNAGREAAGIIAGVAVGALAGRVLSPTTHSYSGGYYRYLGGGYYGYAPGHLHSHTTNLAPLGGVAGAVVGSQMAQAGSQNLQQIYDMVYGNCVESNRVSKRR